MKNIGIKLVTLGLLATTVLAPMSANADVHRQDNKNDLLKVVVNTVLRDVRFNNDWKNQDRDDRARRDDQVRYNRDQRDNRDKQDNSRNQNRDRR